MSLITDVAYILKILDMYQNMEHMLFLLYSKVSL